MCKRFWLPLPHRDFARSVLTNHWHDALEALRFVAGTAASLVTLAASTAAAHDIYPSITVVGGPEVVFDYNKQKCEDVDIPDSFMRAFRRYDGSILAFATHYKNRPLLGKSLTDLKHDCRVSYQGKEDPDPSAFNDRTWLTATWTDDGRRVTALGHNEYQAQRFPGRCRFKTYTECWYNAIVLLQSNDGGESFARMDRDKPIPLAAAPLKADAYQGRPSGYFEPSNIILSDGYYYALIAQRGIEPNSRRCLFRTHQIDSLKSWAVYDGHSFVPVSGNPYEAGPPRAHGLCTSVKGINGVLGSIARIQGTGLFAAFSIDDLPRTPEGGAVEVAFSKDLIHWSGIQPVLKLPPFWASVCPDGHKYSYPSVLDDQVESRNFDTIGSDPFLFAVRSGCSVTLERDLVRFRLHLSMPTASPVS